LVAHQQSLQAHAPAEVFGTTAATSRSAMRLSFAFMMSLPDLIEKETEMNSREPPPDSGRRIVFRGRSGARPRNVGAVFFSRQGRVSA
jgi:hypothetical protein